MCVHTHTDVYNCWAHTVTDMIQHPSGLRQVKKKSLNPQACLIPLCCRGDIRHGYPQTDIQTSPVHFQKRTEVTKVM